MRMACDESANRLVAPIQSRTNIACHPIDSTSRENKLLSNDDSDSADERRFSVSFEFVAGVCRIGTDAGTRNDV